MPVCLPVWPPAAWSGGARTWVATVSKDAKEFHDVLSCAAPLHTSPTSRSLLLNNLYVNYLIKYSFMDSIFF